MTSEESRLVQLFPKFLNYVFLTGSIFFLRSSANQFGFKAGSSCSHAVYTLRRIVERSVNAGSTANLCSIDLTKAFDKTNHYALFIKLMKRLVPIALLSILESWYANCWSCVKWNTYHSHLFKISFGVRQGSVLSPVLFAIYVDDIASRLPFGQHHSILLYADDILLIANSVTELQNLLTSCETELSWLDMAVNIKKSCCLRIGARHSAKCAEILTTDGHPLPWVSEIRYLGVYIVRSQSFKCSVNYAKASFYSAANAIFGKIGRLASEEVTVHLFKAKCLPILLYGLEAFDLSKAVMASLDFTVNRFFMKLFRTTNTEIISDCQGYFNFRLPSVLLAERSRKLQCKMDGVVLV